MQPTPAISCDMTVASAAPATPILNDIMNSRSSTMFATDDSVRKTSGVRLSPSARIMDEVRL